MKKISLWFCCVLFFLPTFFAQAESDTPVSLLQSKLQHMVSLQGEFTQELYNAKNELIGERSTGYFSLQRPGRFYWKTEEPFEQLLVSDQKTIWLYEPDLEQVTVRPFTDDLQQTPALLLSDDIQKIKSSFNVAHEKQGALNIFTLTPKESEQLFSSLQIQFNGPILEIITINDSLRQRTVFALKNTKVNSPIDESLFSFSIPEGVDVLID